MDTNYEVWSKDRLISRIFDLEAAIESLNDANARSQVIELIHKFKISETEGRILSHLYDGRPCTKSNIFNALYWDRAGDLPEMKIVDVYICKLRRKLLVFGLQIETIRGSGYRLVRPDDAQDAASQGAAAPVDQTNFVAGYGKNVKAVLAQIVNRMNSNGEARFTTRAMAAASGIKVQLAPIIERLVERKHIKVRSRPERRNPTAEWVVYVRANSR